MKKESSLQQLQRSKRAELIQHFEQKQKLQPSYSLRAYARDLKMSPALLSQVMNGKRELSEKQIFKLGFTTTAPIEKKKSKRLQGESESTEFVAVDSAIELQQGYEVMLMDLITLKNFKCDVTWISQRLEISTEQALECIEKLIQLGLVKEKNSRYYKTKNKMNIRTTTSLAHIRKINRQFIQKAEQQLNLTDQASFDSRSISGTSMAVNPAHLPEAFRRIAAFQQEMADLLTSGPCTDLYLLNIQLFSALPSMLRKEVSRGPKAGSS